MLKFIVLRILKLQSNFLERHRFCNDDKLIVPNILEERAKEFSAIVHIEDDRSDNIVKMPEGIYVEGGDVMPWDDCIFVEYLMKRIFINIRLHAQIMSVFF